MAKSIRKHTGKQIAAALVLGCMATLLFLAVFTRPGIDISGSDWCKYYRPVARSLDDNPYSVRNVTYPVWMFVALFPLAQLPEMVGLSIMGVISIAVLSYYIKSWWRILLLTASVPVIKVLLYGQVDALLVLAFVLPPQWGLVVASVKPITLLGWAVRKCILANPAKVLFPLVAITLASFTIWGAWPLEMSAADLPATAVGWPYLVPVGLLLLATRSEVLWLIGSAMLTPYLKLYHLIPLMAYVYKRQKPLVLIAITVATWLYCISIQGG